MNRTPLHDAEETGWPPTVPAALARAVAAWPEREAMVDGSRRWTYAQYGRQVEACARGLMARGVQAGDRVALWAPNSAEFAIAAMSVYTAGAIVVPLNTRLTTYEAIELIRRSRATAVFATGPFLGRDYLATLVDSTVKDQLSLRVVLEAGPRPGCLTLAELAEAGEAVPLDSLAARTDAIDGDDISDILFTSGTTGAPKGAMLRHGAGTRAYTEYGRSLGLRPGDRMVGLAPFFHCFGLKGLLLTAVLGGAAVLPQKTFDLAATIELIETEQATMLQGSPTIFNALLDCDAHVKGRLRSLRVAGPGSMGFSPDGYARIRDELGIQQFAPGYALTETTAIVSRCYWFDDFETVSTTSGRPAPGIRVRIADDGGHDLPTGTAGEILVQGYNVMAGYFEDPAATAEAIDAEGWLRTGDIGRFDEQGRLLITDRKKDVFLVGGFNAYPAEIEAVLREHPEVAEVAVIGVPDSRLGQVGKAFVVPAAPPAFDLDALSAYAKERLANFKVPRYWEVMDELPRNASGKVVKFVLRERAAAPQQ